MNYNNKHNLIHDNFYEKCLEIQRSIAHYDISTYLSTNTRQDTELFKPKDNNVLQYSLDKQISDFLSAYYNIKFNSKDDLIFSINKWQYEALIYNIIHAQQNSLAYKDKLAHISCIKLLAELHERHIKNDLCTNDLNILLNKLLNTIDFTIGQSLLDNSEHFLAVEHDLISGLISVETSGTSSLANSIWQSTDTDINKIITHKKRIFCTSFDLASTVNFFFYGMQYILNKSNNKVALLMSGARQGSIGHLLYEAMQLLGVSCKVLGFPIDEEKTMDALLAYEPSCIVGVPSHILSLSHNIRAHLLKPALNCVLLSGDSLSNTMRLVIANNLACEVFAHYGLTETGFGGAVECRAHCGMHLRQLDLYIEIIDNNLNQVPDGKWGEVVITTLSRQAMPLIRYRTGDEGRLISNYCSCGSILKKMEIKGRINQNITLNSEKSIHFIELEEFIHAYSWVVNFEICIFSGDKNNGPCIVIALKLHENAPENALKLISNELELQYKIKSLNCAVKKYRLAAKNLFHNNNESDREEKSKDLATLADIHANGKICSKSTFFLCNFDVYLQLISYNNDIQNSDLGLNNMSQAYVPSTKKYIRHIKGLLPNQHIK